MERAYNKTKDQPMIGIGHRIGPIFGNIGKTSDRQNLTVLTDTCPDV